MEQVLHDRAGLRAEVLVSNERRPAGNLVVAEQPCDVAIDVAPQESVAQVVLAAVPGFLNLPRSILGEVDGHALRSELEVAHGTQVVRDSSVGARVVGEERVLPGQRVDMGEGVAYRYDKTRIGKQPRQILDPRDVVVALREIEVFVPDEKYLIDVGGEEVF